jgi:excinuclease ABC subunit C
MVVWEDGRMKKADYRKFIIRTVIGNDDFASMREVVTRRYSRLQEEKTPMPGLVLIDGGIGQLHRCGAWRNQRSTSRWRRLPREELICRSGGEPIVLDRFSPILHLIQSIRDEAHQFAVTFRTRRNAQGWCRTDRLWREDGTLLKHFGSSEMVKAAPEEELAKLVGPVAARKVREYYAAPVDAP